MKIFDLEQKIMDCWGVVDDMEEVADEFDDPRVKEAFKNLATLYGIKFNNLFGLFEEHCKEYHEARRASQIS